MTEWDDKDIKRFFLACELFAAENPTLIGKAYNALNVGTLEAVARLSRENSNMAFGMITALDLTTPKVWNKKRNELTRFIGTLADWFKGAPVEKKLRDWLNEEAQNDKG